MSLKQALPFQLWMLSILLIGGCTTRLVRIESNPVGAQVLIKEKAVGVTPLEISESDYAQEFKEGFLQVSLESPGYQRRDFVIAANATRSLEVQLSALNADYFKKSLLANYKGAANGMIRDILLVQAQLLARQYDGAEQLLKAFTDVYPNVAAAYVLQAQIEIYKGNQAQAFSNLKRAQSLDPQDPVVGRMLDRIKAGGGA